VNRAVVLAAMLVACSLREPRVTTTTCARSSQCSNANVCFLGECRAPAANLSIVTVEVRPPSGSPFGVRKLQMDLRLGVVNDFPLSVLYSVAGAVTQDGSGVDGGTVVFTDHTPLIPDRVEQVVATTDVSGVYRPRLPQGIWDVLVQPPGVLPPYRAGPLDTAASPSLDFALPATASLIAYDGGLSVSEDGGPIAGARVSAVDSRGLAISAASVSDADGGYSLLVPPANEPFWMQIGPNTDVDGGVAQTAAPEPFPTYPPLPYAPSLVLPLPPPATLTVRVVDSAGAPVPSAVIYVRTSDTAWTLARSAVTGTGESSIPLREGNYLVQAAPPPDTTAPALSSAHAIKLPAAGPIELTCPPKVRRFAKILDPDGKPVGVNFQVIATRIADALVPTRTAYTTPTDANGVFHIVADAGSWRLEIVPPVDVRLPRTIVGVTFDGDDPGESSMDAIRISRALRLGGLVTGRLSPGAADSPVRNAMLSFFSLDPNGRSIFLGGGRTDDAGHYDIVLPDIAQAGAGP
jgi:hypothetical protein